MDLTFLLVLLVSLHKFLRSLPNHKFFRDNTCTMRTKTIIIRVVSWGIVPVSPLAAYQSICCTLVLPLGILELWTVCLYTTVHNNYIYTFACKCVCKVTCNCITSIGFVNIILRNPQFTKSPVSLVVFGKVSCLRSSISYFNIISNCRIQFYIKHSTDL